MGLRVKLTFTRASNVLSRFADLPLEVLLINRRRRVVKVTKSIALQQVRAFFKAAN